VLINDSTVIRQYNGVETVIYSNEQLSEQSNVSNIAQAQIEKQETGDPANYWLYIIIGLGLIIVLFGIVLFVRKKSKIHYEDKNN